MLMRGATLARLIGGQGGFANADRPFHSGVARISLPARAD